MSPRTFFNYFATKDDAIIGDPLADGAALRDEMLALPAEIPIVGAILLALAPAVALGLGW